MTVYPFSDLLDGLENRRPTLLFRIQRFPYMVKSRYHSLVHEVKHRVARMKHGWSPQDVWDWDNWHARIVAESLEHYAEVCHGWPGEEWGTFEEYKEMIQEIADAYRAYYEFPEPVMINGHYDFKAHNAFHEKMMDRLKVANQMLIENYYSIWD